MSKIPKFVEFAAIQIFAALIQIRDAGESFETRANDSWRFAKMLYDAKPVVEPVVIRTKYWDETRGNKRDGGKQKDTVDRLGDS